jgi:hypothetical protein
LKSTYGATEVAPFQNTGLLASQNTGLWHPLQTGRRVCVSFYG